MTNRLHRFALFYPMRIVGSYFLVFVVALYSLQFERLTLFRIFLIAFLLIYPHVIRYLVWRNPQDRLKIELRAFLLDSFLLGLVVHLTGFTPLPSFALTTIALVNALAVTGARQMLYSASALLMGIAVAMLFGGLNFQPKEYVPLDIAVSVFMFVYFIFFAYSAYHSNLTVAQQRTELREQKAILEIEKQRSDALLLNLVPAEIAAELKKGGNVQPAVFESVTLLAIDFCGFSDTLEDNDSGAVLKQLIHCFKAFDAICGRYGFEKLKTMGDLYLAVCGIPKARPQAPAEAVNAALEIQQFLSDFNESRRAHGQFTLEARIAIHTGAVIGGIVATEKLSYDLWGRAIKLVLLLVAQAASGQILISDATRRLAGDGFKSIPAGKIDWGVGSEIPFFNIDKRAA